MGRVPARNGGRFFPLPRPPRATEFGGTRELSRPGTVAARRAAMTLFERFFEILELFKALLPFMLGMIELGSLSDCRLFRELIF